MWLWPLLFQVTPLLGHGGDVLLWLGLAESVGRALGPTMLVAEARAGPARAVRMAFGACAVVFGLSHFAYADFTAAMIPGWIPAHLPLAYLTGAVHVATGLCLLAGVRSQLAAAVEGAMMTGFVLLLHVPRVIAAPAARVEWTMLAVAVTLSAAAWLVATSARRTE